MPEPTAPIEALIAEIRQQASAEIEAVEKAAAREQSLIAQRANLEAEKIRAGIIKKARQNAELSYQRTLAVAKLEVKKIELQARSLIIAEIRRRLADWLAKYRLTPDYADLLRNLINAGIAGLGNEDVLIVAGDRERNLLTDDFLKALGASRQPPVKITLLPEILPESGVILYSADRRMRFDNRLTSFGERLFEKYQWTIMQTFNNNSDVR
jgi:vacuolar-type H+-ATPase subunit E/Vma4